MKGLLLLAFIILSCISINSAKENGAPGVNAQTIQDLRLQLETEKLQRLQLEVRVDALVNELGTHHSTGTINVNPVGFSVAQSKSSHMFATGTMRYNTVFTNTGNAFDASTGMFTAPVHGIYNFYFANLVSGDHTLKMDLIVNSGSGIVFAESYGTTTRDASGSASCVIEVNAGSKVFVRAHADSRIFGNNWSSFTGFLVQNM